MARISRPDVTNALVDFFLSAGENPTPSELSEEVLFTFPFSAPTTELTFATYEALAGPAGNPIVDLATVPAGEYWLYHTAEIDHNDIDRPGWLALSDAGPGGGVVRIAFEQVITSTGFLVARNIVVPPGWRLRGQLDVITGTAVLVVRSMKTEHKIAQPLMGTSS